MPFSIAADGNYLRRSTSPPNYNAVYAMMAWSYRDSGTGYSAVFSLNDGDNSDADWCGWEGGSPGNLNLTSHVANGPGDAAQAVGTTIGIWHHFAMVRESATLLRLYLNGVSQLTLATDVSARTAVVNLDVGNEAAVAIPFIGRIGAIKIWSGGTAFTADEVNQEMRVIRPVRLANLYSFNPGFLDTDLADWSGAGNAWSKVGTLTTADGFPVPWGVQAPSLRRPLVSVITQIVRPNATISAGGWLDHAASATDLHSPLADESAATWIQSPANPVNATVKLGLTDIATPGAGDIYFELDAEQI